MMHGQINIRYKYMFCFFADFGSSVDVTTYSRDISLERHLCVCVCVCVCVYIYTDVNMLLWF